MERVNRVNLDTLEAVLAKATPGEWKWSINGKRVQVAAVRHAAQVCAVWNTSAHPASVVADAIVVAHNALPALIAEVRELREDADRARWCEENEANVGWSSVDEVWVVHVGIWRYSRPSRSAAIDAARGVGK